MGSRFYLENEAPKRDASDSEANLRARLAGMIPHTDFSGKLDPRSANIEVLKTLAGPIEGQFRDHAAKKGVLIAEEYLDHRGLACRRYHGSARDEIRESFAAPGVTVRVAKTVTFNGKNFLESKIPNSVRAQMYARSVGAE